MKTKEEYEKALKEINDAFYGANFLNNQTRRFDDNLNLLRELVNEHFEEKKYTNFEHYKDGIIELCLEDLAISKGKISKCNETSCDECIFSDKNGVCIGNYEIKDWFNKLYKKLPYKLSKFEFDLLNAYKNSGMRQCIQNYGTLLEMYVKGHFKGIDTSTPIHEILDNCEVME